MNIKQIFKDISISVFGCIIAAFGTACFLLPNKLSSGGFAGIATIFYYLFNLKMGTTIIILNVPLFILAYIKFGKYFMCKTIISTFIFSKFTDIFVNSGAFIIDNFLASIYGGILVGIGQALVFRVESSTGGSDLIAIIAGSYNSHVKIGKLLVMLDFIIVFTNLIVFRNIEIGLYSFISIYIISKMIDLVFEGINFSKMIYIISDKSDEISKSINFDLKKGATQIYGKGCYSQKEKNIIMCVTKRNNLIKINEIVKGIDENAFIIITDVREVFGLGFK